MNFNIVKTFYIIVLVLFLGSCATKRQEMIRLGHPPAYADGYQDGYHSGKGSAASLINHYKRDNARFDTDKQYALGWNVGFADGESKQEELDKTLKKADKAARQKRYEYRERSRMERDTVSGTELGSLDNFGD